METKFVNSFKAARRAGAPLVCVKTPDPVATIISIKDNADKFLGSSPIILWDVINGMRAANDGGNASLAEALQLTSTDKEATTNPVAALVVATQLYEKSILFMYNIQRFIDPQSIQAIWNLRDLFKDNFRTLVMLCPQMTLPPELAQDTLMLDEPLPTIAELEKIVTEQFDAAIAHGAKIDPPSTETLNKATDAICGLAAFPAEQVVAMSLSTKFECGIDLDSLWERKRSAIEQIKGLSVWRGGETFDSVGGCDNAKNFLTRVINGKNPPRAIVYIDEIEKAMAGSQGDTSGVSQDMLGTLLSWMQDNEATGVIFIGPPGSGKSNVAKATGNTAGIPTISFDLSGMKGSLVGESGTNIREALKTVQAVSQGRTLFIATCNSISVLPPELRRRFGFGTFFFDLPDDKERDAIWKIYETRYQLTPQKRPSDKGWTGAEIKQACLLADTLQCSLLDAATYIVPVATSASESISRLRDMADGRFISASYPGIYKSEHVEAAVATLLAPKRKLDVN